MAAPSYVAENSEEADGVIETKIVEPQILGAFPKPFHTSVQLNFRGNEIQMVCVEIYYSYGRMVREFSKRTLNPGWHNMQWDGMNDRGNDCTNGTYIMTLRNNMNFVVQSTL